MAVTANQLISRQDGCRGSLPVAASTRLYGGTLVFITAAGFADDDTASGLNGFAGVNLDDVDNSAGSAGDLVAEFSTEGDFVFPSSGLSQANVGDIAYASDNYTVSPTPGASSVPIGRIVGILSATKAVVKIKTSGPAPAAVNPLTLITHVGPSSADYAIQDLINASAWGFATKDEGNTLLSVVKNLQARVIALESRG